MTKFRRMIPGLLGIMLLSVLALVFASRAIGQDEPPGEQGYPGPVPQTPVDSLPVSSEVVDDGSEPLPTNTPLADSPESFDPKTYGLPDVIAGYKLLAVLNSQNRACLAPGRTLLVLQSTQLTLDDYLNEQNSGQAPNVEEALRALGLNPADYFWSIGGPDATRDQVIQDTQEWNKLIEESGCNYSGPPPTVLAPTDS